MLAGWLTVEEVFEAGTICLTLVALLLQAGFRVARLGLWDWDCGIRTVRGTERVEAGPSVATYSVSLTDYESFTGIYSMCLTDYESFTGISLL